MIPTPGRCLAMTVTAIALAAALLMVGVPDLVLVALTPGLLCLTMAFAAGRGDPHAEELLMSRMATARHGTGRSRRPVRSPSRALPDQ